MQSYLTWVAIYDDGTEIKEKDVESTEKVDRSRLKEFRLFKGDALVFVGFFNSNKKLIFRRRTYLDSLGQVQGVVYLVGYHEKIGKGSVKSICYVYDDGHIEFDGDRNDLQLVPCEEF